MSAPEPVTILGISGPAGSGKDAAAGAVALHRGAVRPALADAFKGAFDDLSGITRDWHKDLDSETDWPLRKTWQLLGTEAREIVPGARLAWVQVTLIKIAYAAFLHPKPRTRFVVPDIRHPFEAEEFARVARFWGGSYATFCLDRPGLAPPPGVAGHSSEAHYAALRLRPESIAYRNRGTLADLHAAAVAAFEEARTSRRFSAPLPCPGPGLAALDEDAA